jgi:hypothetical protein
VSVGALVLLGFVLNVPFLNALLRISSLDAQDLALCGLAGVASIAWFELLKVFVKRSARSSVQPA